MKQIDRLLHGARKIERVINGVIIVDSKEVSREELQKLHNRYDVVIIDDV